MGEESAPWLFRLVKDIKTARCTCRAVQLKPTSYDLRVPDSTARVFNFSSEELEPSPEALETCVLAALHSTIRTWLAFPTTQSVSCIQGTFVRHLTSVFGSGQVLLLEKVWNFYRFPRTSLLGHRLGPRQAFQPDMLDDFLEDLEALPLAQPDSEERHLLSEIEEAVNTHRALVSGSAPPSHPPPPPPAPPSPPASQPSTSSAACKAPTFSVVPVITTVSERTIQSAAAKLKSFILDLLPLIEPAGPPPNPTPIQLWALEDLDYHLPFRQHAPETLSARAPGSFAHPSSIALPGALASLWFARGVTYRTLFSRTYPTERFFHTLAAWEAKRAAVVADRDLSSENGEDRKYFCNITAYGAPAHDRREENFQVYFELEAVWRREFPPGEPVAYLTAQSWMLSHLPGIGKLTSALCASDLVYAGLVEAPSVEDMGNLVCSIKAGAVKGIKALGLVDKNAVTSKIFPIFGRLYHSLHSSLDDTQRARMDFDVIMYEHLLCKYHRAHNK